MRKPKVSTKVWRYAIAALGAWLSLGITAAQAQSALCGTLSEKCAIANAVYEWNLDQFFPFFPMDGATCDNMTKNILKQCETAAKTAISCWRSQVASIPKTAKFACKTEGNSASGCNAGFASMAAGARDEVEADGEGSLACCEEIAANFSSFCRFDGP